MMIAIRMMNIIHDQCNPISKRLEISRNWQNRASVFTAGFNNSALSWTLRAKAWKPGFVSHFGVVSVPFVMSQMADLYSCFQCSRFERMQASRGRSYGCTLVVSGPSVWSRYCSVIQSTSHRDLYQGVCKIVKLPAQLHISLFYSKLFNLWNYY